MTDNKRHKAAKGSAPRQVYDEFWKQAAAAWDVALRDPGVLAAVSAASTQQFETAARVREAFAGALKAMNLASRDDVVALGVRLDAIEANIDRLAKAIAELQTQRTAPPKRPARRH